VLCVRLQRELNRLWEGQGNQIDQHGEAIDLVQTLDTPSATGKHIRPSRLPPLSSV
jgi:hypothetical protein